MPVDIVAVAAVVAGVAVVAVISGVAVVALMMLLLVFRICFKEPCLLLRLGVRAAP